VAVRVSPCSEFDAIDAIGAIDAIAKIHTIAIVDFLC
jgi:hypothetical protein